MVLSELCGNSILIISCTNIFAKFLSDILDQFLSLLACISKISSSTQSHFSEEMFAIDHSLFHQKIPWIPSKSSSSYDQSCFHSIWYWIRIKHKNTFRDERILIKILLDCYFFSRLIGNILKKN